MKIPVEYLSLFSDASRLDFFFNILMIASFMSEPLSYGKLCRTDLVCFLGIISDQFNLCFDEASSSSLIDRAFKELEKLGHIQSSEIIRL